MNKYAKCFLIDYMQDRESALIYFAEASSLSEDWAAFNILRYYCADEEGLNMIKKLSTINNDQNKFKAYIDRLNYICATSRNTDIKEGYKDLAKEIIQCV